MRYLLFFFLFSGCASFQPAPYYFAETPALQALLDIYVEEKARFLGDGTASYPITIKIGPTEDDQLAYCRLLEDRSYAPRIIVMGEFMMEYFSKETQLQVLFHEMGHCDLNLDHSKGIMAEHVLYTPYFLDNYDILLSELFLGESLKSQSKLPIGNISGGRYD